MITHLVRLCVFTKYTICKYATYPWYCCVVVITTAQIHSTKPDLRFCTSSNPAYGISEICDGNNL